jgi:hypothetical protein
MNNISIENNKTINPIDIPNVIQSNHHKNYIYYLTATKAIQLIKNTPPSTIIAIMYPVFEESYLYSAAKNA